MSVVLETSALGKSFGALRAADDIGVTVGAGEVVGVIGANGAGKTTFVNLVTGYLRPDRGRILFMGREITGLAPRQIARLGVRRSFQIPQLFGELTSLDNLLVAIAIARRRNWGAWRSIRRAEWIAASDALLARFGIEAHRDRPASVLAQGVRKLLDIAMATVAEPRLMLLDEPTSGVSFEEKFALMDRLMAALGAGGASILFIEHDMEIVESYAERVLAFYDGRVIADGPTADVLADPEVRRHVVGSEIHRRRATPCSP